MDAELLAAARDQVQGNDASVVEATLRALLAGHRAAQIDRAYADAYSRAPSDTLDDWSDLDAFLDAASRV